MRSELPGVLHLVDSLAIGGTERVAVNLVNHLPRDRFRSFLCTTRREGPLATAIAADVGRLALARRYTVDLSALGRLVRFVQAHRIRLLHAHSSSLFIAALASLFPPFPAVIWHDHYGRHDTDSRSVAQYRLVSSRASYVIAVNQSLAEWSRTALHVPADRVRYIPNFAWLASNSSAPPNLAGEPGQRIVCVANLRPQKDHVTLLRAMELVIREEAGAHLLLVGIPGDASYQELVLSTIASLGLKRNVSFLGQREDVASILRQCDIGVLSSASEGLPLALIEYGLAGLPVVTTRVGQCAEVLDDGRAGLLVTAGRPEELAAAIVRLLRSSEEHALLGETLQRRVRSIYSAEAVVGQVCDVYDQVLSSASFGAVAHRS